MVATFDEMSDEELRCLVDDGAVGGWGTSCTATAPDGSLVFIKRLPLTAREYAVPNSTKNLFQLPTYYQYGVGSAGFGAWRELATHLAVDSPVLLHHRVMATTGTEPSAKVHPRSELDLPGYVDYWGGSKRIGSYVEARRSAPFELWLVLEHVPHRLFEWIGDHQNAIGAVTDALLNTIRAWHDRGMFHFDAHFGNVVTDGSRFVLTDFGLATSRAFDLSADESAFIDHHLHYDFGEVIYNVGNALLHFLMRTPDAKQLLDEFGVDGPRDHDEVVTAFVMNIDAVAERLDVAPPYAAMVTQYREVIVFMAKFFADLRTSPKKDTFFDDARLASLLRDVGV